MNVPRPPIFRVLLTFARNSLVRDMTFRGNFLIEAVTSMGWMLHEPGFYVLIFRYTPMIGAAPAGASTSSSSSSPPGCWSTAWCRRSS